MTIRTLILETTIWGNPQPKERPRVAHVRRKVDGEVKIVPMALTPARTHNAEVRLGWEIKAELAGHGGPDDAKYAVECRFYEQRVPGKHADGDNMLKTICDALNGVVWLDDAQVIEHHAYTFRDQSRPRTELRIWRLEGT